MVNAMDWEITMYDAADDNREIGTFDFSLENYPEVGLCLMDDYGEVEIVEILDVDYDSGMVEVAIKYVID